MARIEADPSTAARFTAATEAMQADLDVVGARAEDLGCYRPKIAEALQARVEDIGGDGFVSFLVRESLRQGELRYEPGAFEGGASTG